MESLPNILYFSQKWGASPIEPTDSNMRRVPKFDKLSAACWFCVGCLEGAEGACGAGHCCALRL